MRRRNAALNFRKQRAGSLTSVYTTSHAATSGLRSDFAYNELKHRLLLGEYGLSSRLGEERLAAMFGVSRTPVREALMRLQAGVLRSTDQPFADIREITEVAAEARRADAD